MFGFKKVVATVAVTLASIAVPSLALADDHDGWRGNNNRNDEYSIAQLRAEIQRDRIELQRDRYEHRWAAARREMREIERREAQLRELMRHRHGR